MLFLNRCCVLEKILVVFLVALLVPVVESFCLHPSPQILHIQFVARSQSQSLTKSSKGIWQMSGVGPASDISRFHCMAKSLLIGSLKMGALVSAVRPAFLSAETTTTKGYQTKSGLRYFDYIVGNGVQPRYGMMH